MNRRTCRACQRPFDDAGPGKRPAPSGFCSEACSRRAKTKRANARASRRAVPPRAPSRLFAPTSRDWTDPWVKILGEGRCRVTGKPVDGDEKIDPAHIIPRSMAPNGGEDARNIVPLARSIHEAYDLGHFDLLPHLRLDEQAYAVELAGGITAALRVISGREAAA